MASIIRCPQCDQNTTDALRPTPAFLSASDEVAFIHKETQRLDHLIHQLNEDRAALLRRLNQMQSSTGSCPPEVLSLAFLRASPPLDFHARNALCEGTNEQAKDVKRARSPLILGGVCSYWRQVVYFTPQLWRTVAVHVDGENIEKKANLLQFYINNTGELPISVELDFRQKSGLPWLSGTELNPVKSLVSDSASKFEALSLNFPPFEWISMLDHRFSGLEDLAIGWPEETEIDLTGNGGADDGAMSFISLPRLTRVAFNNLAEKAVLSWSTITVLKLFNTRINLCVDLLLQCPNLVEYRCRRGGELAAYNSSRFHGPISFPLKIFEWSCISHPDSYELLQNIRLPAVEVLGLDQGFDDEDLDVLWVLLDEVSPKLLTLELSSCVYDRSTLQRIFLAANRIQNLHLHDCDIDRFEEVFSILCLRRNDKFLPQLGHMSVDGSFDKMSTEDRSTLMIPLMLLRMLDGKKEALNGCFRLDLQHRYDIGWEFSRYEFKDAICLRGWQLEIYEGGELIECLRDIYEKKRMWSEAGQALESSQAAEYMSDDGYSEYSF